MKTYQIFFLIMTFVVCLNAQIFTKVTDKSIVEDSHWSCGCFWVDINNDDNIDLFIPNVHDQNNQLFINNGDMTFTEITDDPIVLDGSYSYGGTWGDYNNDGLIDFFCANSGTNFYIPILAIILFVMIRN